MPAGRFSFLTFFLKNDKIGMELCDARTGIFLKNAPDRMNDMFNEAMAISVGVGQAQALRELA